MAPSSCTRDRFLRPQNVPQEEAGRDAYARVQNLRRQAATRAQNHVSGCPSADPAVEDENERNVEEAEAAVLQQYEVIDLTEDAPQQAQAHSSGTQPNRQVEDNVSSRPGHRAVSSYTLGDTNLKLGTCVELREPLGEWTVEFLELKSIWVSDSHGSLTIRGVPYTRNRNLRGLLETKKNEVCQVLEFDADDKRVNEVQGQIQISLQQILRVRALNKTNAVYPRYLFGGQGRWRGKTAEQLEEQAPLTNRWKLYIQYRDNRPDFWVIVRTTEAEADERFRVADKETRADFRGNTHRGGSHKPHVVNLDDGINVPTTRKDRQYTYADMFCGGGGATRGAVMAGLKLVCGVDRCPESCATWRLNFPGARMFEQDATEFIHNHDIDHLSHPIDILHLSPPCQFWSPLAYPHAGQNNEENMAILFACSELIKKMRPRLFTLEQTFGLTHDAHVEFLNALVLGFTTHGYSVQWKVVPLAEYGLPQTRKRLIMIGACPGEQLPPWPPATHSAVPTRGLKPLFTEAAAIQNLDSRRVTLHDKANARQRDLPPRNGNVPFPRTITCGGTQNTSHFSGRRDFTPREIACLQGFPVSHQFVGTKTAIKKQIGNAFPPCVVKAFYDHLRTWLQDVDGVRSDAVAASVRQVSRPLLERGHQRGDPAHASSMETRHHFNGDLDEDEALQLALQASMRRPHPSASALIEIPDEEGQQDSPVSAVAPLLERMSIAPSESQPIASHGRESTLESRSRSVTLDFSPSSSPSPGPSRRAESGPQKRSIDSVHDGNADKTMKEGSPPKRERMLDGQSRGDVDDAKIPCELPRYTGPQVARDGDDEVVLVGHTERSSQGDVGKSGSTPRDRGSHRGTIVDNIAPRDSGSGLLGRLWQASKARKPGEEVWTFF